MQKTTLICILLIAYTLLFGVINFVLYVKNYKNALESYSNYQGIVIDNVMYEFKNLSADEIEEPSVIDKIFKFQDTYGFVYKDNMVIYEMDIETTKKYENSTARELFNDYSLDSGRNIVMDITNIIFEDEGTEYLTKNNKFGKEIISWKVLERDGDRYIIGIADTVNNVLKKRGFYTNTVVTALLYVINLVIVTVLCYIFMKITKKLSKFDKM